MKLKSILFVSVLGLFMNSCSGDDVTTQSTKGTPIKFTANIQSIAPSFGTRVDNNSSGILTNDFPVGSEISVGYINMSIPPVLKKQRKAGHTMGLNCVILLTVQANLFMPFILKYLKAYKILFMEVTQAHQTSLKLLIIKLQTFLLRQLQFPHHQELQ